MVHNVTGSPVALVSGGRGIVLWSGVLTNGSSTPGTATYYIKSYHCATIGGTYVEGNSLTVTVNLQGKPWATSSRSVTRPNPQECRITFNYTGTPGNFKFRARDSNLEWKEAEWTPNGSPEDERVYTTFTFNVNPALIAWELWVWYGNAWRKEAENVV